MLYEHPSDLVHFIYMQFIRQAEEYMSVGQRYTSASSHVSCWISLVFTLQRFVDDLSQVNRSMPGLGEWKHEVRNVARGANKRMVWKREVYGQEDRPVGWAEWA